MSTNAPSTRFPLRATLSRAALATAAAALWLAVPTLGFAALLRHQYAAGDHGAGVAPRDRFSAVGVAADRPRALIVTLHPQCPCSNTTLEELRQLLHEAGDSVRATALFVVPAGIAGLRADASEALAEPWVKSSPSWHRAATIPGLLRVLVSESDARSLGPRTSGHVLLFDADGTLQFDGGITLGRGHAGDNDGRRALAAALRGDPVPNRMHPVYGCGLFDAPARPPTADHAQPSCCAEADAD